MKGEAASASPSVVLVVFMLFTTRMPSSPSAPAARPFALLLLAAAAADDGPCWLTGEGSSLTWLTSNLGRLLPLLAGEAPDELCSPDERGCFGRSILHTDDDCLMHRVSWVEDYGDTLHLGSSDEQPGKDRMDTIATRMSMQVS